MGAEERTSCEARHSEAAGRHNLLAEPLNLAASLARILAASLLLAPRRFARCGADARAAEQAGGALLGASAVLGTAHLFFGIRLLQLAEVALLALFLVWLVFEWLRRVLQAPLTLRLVAALAVPTVQAALVRLVYPLVPLEELVRDLATTSPPR